MRLSILLSFLILLPVASSSAERLYHVGNSHTVDIKPHAEFRTMVESRGDTILNDWHINCGASLDRIYNYPAQVCIGSELWPDALSNPEWGGWDAIILQPFQAPNPALFESAAAINLIQNAITNLPNADATYYIYATWPQNTSPGNLADFDYAAAYLQPFTNENTDSVAQQREFFIYLMKALADAGLGVTIKPIPVSEVLYNFDIRARAGGVPGYVSAGAVYRDALHMDWPGVYLAALTTYAVVYDVDPRTVGVVPGFVGVTAAQAAAIGEVVYETLQGPVFSVGPEETKLTIDAEIPLNTVKVRFKTFTGYYYAVLASSDLANWASVTGTIRGNSEVFELDLSATENLSFFRIVDNLAPPPPNVPPTVDYVTLQTSVEGMPADLQIVASDANGDTLSYAASGLPPGLTLNASDGRITGTISQGAAMAGLFYYAVIVSVSDGVHPPVSRLFLWRVYDDVTFGGSTSYSSGDTLVGSFAVDVPAAVQAEDLLLMSMYHGADPDPAITVPAGWTQLYQQSTATGGKHTVFYKIAVVSEPPSYTWQLSQTKHVAAVMAAYRGVDTASPFNAQVAEYAAGAGSISAQITTTVGGAQLVMFTAFKSASSGATPDASLSERSDLTAGGGTRSLNLADEPVALSGPATRSVAIDDPGGAVEIFTLLVALRPDAYGS